MEQSLRVLTPRLSGDKTGHTLVRRQSRASEERTRDDRDRASKPGRPDNAGVAPQPDQHPERALLVKEMRVACTQSMLLCLDRGHRLAYILGEILELDGVEAASILDLSPAAFLTWKPSSPAWPRSR